MSGTDVAAHKLRERGASAVFQAVDAPYVILDRQLVIRAVNQAYAEATLRSPEELQDRYLFDAFPDNPDDPHANGVAQLGASLERVLRERTRHRMRLQRHDIMRPHAVPLGRVAQDGPRVARAQRPAGRLRHPSGLILIRS